MTITFTIEAGRLLLALLLATGAGALYAWQLNRRLEWLAAKATELSVVIGTAMTLLIAIIVLPALVVGVLVLLFAATGISQMLRSAYNRSVREPARVAQERARVAQAATANLPRHAEELSNGRIR